MDLRYGEETETIQKILNLLIDPAAQLSKQLIVDGYKDQFLALNDGSVFHTGFQILLDKDFRSCYDFLYNFQVHDHVLADCIFDWALFIFSLPNEEILFRFSVNEILRSIRPLEEFLKLEYLRSKVSHR